MGMDAQLIQHFEYGRIDQSVTFQFDDDQIAHILVHATYFVVKTQSRVDGQPFGLPLVYQRDAREVVVQCRLQSIYSIV